jgi:mono/diheme cytochrome c family protein
VLFSGSYNGHCDGEAREGIREAEPAQKFTEKENYMDRQILTAVVIMAVGVSFAGGCKKETPQKVEAPPAAPAMQPAPAPQPPVGEKTGEALFKTHCAVCHPDGGNVVKHEHTLHKASLKEHNLNTAADIVKIMRNPGPGMTAFNESTLPEQEATAIAEYILKTF